MRLAVYVVPIALLLYALIDLSRSAPSERAGISRPAWVAIVVLLPVVGPAVWLLVSWTQETRRNSGPTPPPPPSRPGPRPPRRPSPAPDDDAEFLWRLEQQRRRRRGAPPRRNGTSPDNAPPDDDAGPG